MCGGDGEDGGCGSWAAGVAMVEAARAAVMVVGAATATATMAGAATVEAAMVEAAAGWGAAR